MHFANGSPIAGRLSQRETFPPDLKVAKILRKSELRRKAASRFTERDAKPGKENAAPLWEEAMAQVGRGG